MCSTNPPRLKKKISRGLNFSIRERDFFYSRKRFFLFAKELLAILRKKKSRGLNFSIRERDFFLFAKELLAILRKKNREG